jgi:hypothetical protein
VGGKEWKICTHFSALNNIFILHTDSLSVCSILSHPQKSFQSYPALKGRTSLAQGNTLCTDTECQIGLCMLIRI